MTGDTQDETQPAAGSAGSEATPEAVEELRYNIRAQYLKDISFENPNAPLVYSKLNSQPDIRVSVDVQARALEARAFEVVLSANVDAKFGDTQGFLSELQYCALVVVAESVAQEDLEPLLLVEIPHQLFPFARALISSATRDGGFPPLLINPIDFGKLYLQQRAQKAAGAEAAVQPAG